MFLASLLTGQSITLGKNYLNEKTGRLDVTNLTKFEIVKGDKVYTFTGQDIEMGAQFMRTVCRNMSDAEQ